MQSQLLKFSLNRGNVVIKIDRPTRIVHFVRLPNNRESVAHAQ